MRPQKTQSTVVVCFLEVGTPVEVSTITNHYKSETFQNNMHNHTPLRLWILGDFSRHGKQNKRLCYLMLQDHAANQTHRPHTKYHHLWHDQDRATHQLCQKTTVTISGSHITPTRRGASKKVCPLHTTSRQKKGWTSTHAVFDIHSTLDGGQRWHASRKADSHASQGSFSMEKTCGRLLRSRRMMMIPNIYYNG